MMRAQVARSVVLTPGVVAFLASNRVRQRPDRPLDLLQRIDPVHCSPLGVVLLTRHRDVSAVLRNQADFSSDEANADPSLLRVSLLERFIGARGNGGADRRPLLDLFDLLMLFRDPPDHTRLRALVSKAFTPRRVLEAEERIRVIAETLLAPHLVRRGFDLMTDFAYPFPAVVICELLGVPEAGVPLFVQHAPALAIALDPSPMRTVAGVQRANVAVRALTTYVRELIAERRTTPADDMLSDLVHAESEGDRLSEEELVATVLLLVVAGHETTANVIGNAVMRFISSPDTKAQVASLGEDGWRAGVDEFLRLDGPVQMAQRIALVDTEVGGRTVRAGQLVIPILAAANRDPNVFVEPRSFRADRSPNPHLAFGAGHHYCIGAALARLELYVALEALSALPASLTLAKPPVRRRSFTIKGLESLVLRW
jgi:pimeloyl-[acyl-carrier protein] synthase